MTAEHDVVDGRALAGVAENTRRISFEMLHPLPFGELTSRLGEGEKGFVKIILKNPNRLFTYPTEMAR